jgi:hypothetical protein
VTKRRPSLAGRRVGTTLEPERLGQIFALLLPVAAALFLIVRNAPGAI